jgi:SAM-dependent methyltransferase
MPHIPVETAGASPASDHFGAEYFCQRQGNDPRRQRSFAQERAYLLRWLGQEAFVTGTLLDVGCSTGEFIDALGWNRDRIYGMEISAYAREVAARKGVRFDRDLLNAEEFFDLIVFRGTIQYISNPFHYIQRAFQSLKPGGHIVFIATPNTNSPYYRHFGTLPFLEEPVNYWIPADASLRMVLSNCGFALVDLCHPYFGTPYAQPLRDHVRFLFKILFRTRTKFAFRRSMLWALARKPALAQ